MKYFSEDMTSLEAQKAYFQLIDGKTSDEKEEINKEYQSVLPVIIERETEIAQDGWMC